MNQIPIYRNDGTEILINQVELSSPSSEDYLRSLLKEDLCEESRYLIQRAILNFIESENKF